MHNQTFHILRGVIFTRRHTEARPTAPPLCMLAVLWALRQQLHLLLHPVSGTGTVPVVGLPAGGTVPGRHHRLHWHFMLVKLLEVLEPVKNSQNLKSYEVGRMEPNTVPSMWAVATHPDSPLYRYGTAPVALIPVTRYQPVKGVLIERRMNCLFIKPGVGKSERSD
jgi:hypothetical protein